jgi:hypothetical protein
MSQDPVRLRHDSAIRPGLREDLAIARRSARAPYDETQGLARLQASLRGGGGSGGSPPPQAPSAGGLAHAIPWGSAAVGAVGAVVVLALWSWLVPTADSSPPAAPPAIESAAAVAPLPLASSTPRLDPQAIASSRPSAPPRPTEPILSAAPRSEAGIAAPSPSLDPTASAPMASSRATLAEEVAHLARARDLAASDPASALVLIEEGHRRFAFGALWLERETIAFGALMRLGRRDEAARRGARIVERYPDSLNARNIQSALGQPQGP